LGRNDAFALSLIHNDCEISSAKLHQLFNDYFEDMLVRAWKSVNMWRRRVWSSQTIRGTGSETAVSNGVNLEKASIHKEEIEDQRIC
jgi:hypothetical protein